MKTQRFTLLFLMLLGAFITHVALAQKAVAPPTQNGPGDTQYKIASSQNGLLSTSYVVSGAGYTEVNGTYVQSGTYKYEYYNSSNGMTYVMGFSDMFMSWHIGDESFWEWDPYYTNNSYSNTPPSTGWMDYMGMSPSPTVSEAGRTLSFNTSIFIEHENNDGSISNSIIITYNEYGGDALTGVPDDDFVVGNKVTVTNVPTGLTPQMIKTANNQLTFSLVGNAQDHSSEHSVSTIRVEFQNSAFVGGDAANIIGYLKSDIKLYYDFFSGGNGSVEEPYLISNKYDLRLLSENITGSLWEKHFKQTADITFELSDFQEGGIFFNDGEGWIPIGNNSKQFVGRYNGGYKTISGLFINRPDTDYQGFFGVIGGGCRVENLGLINVSITGKDRLGGFVGTSFSSSTRSFIGNCYVIGTVSRSENSNVFYYGGAGGFIGSASYLNIENCYASATVTGNQSVGGFVGIIERQSTIQNCYALGDVFSNGRYVGGFVGYPWYSESVIENCYARGNVTRTSGSATEFGGFCGENYNSKIQKSYSTGSVIYGEVVQTNKGFCGKIVTPVVMSGNFWDTQTSGATTTTTNDNATGKTTAQMKTQSTFTDAGWDFTESTGIWSINSEDNDGYPYHQWQDYVPTYTVNYNANEATGGTIPAPQTKEHNVTLILATNSGNLVRTNFTFIGWNTQADGLGTDYAVGAEYTANDAVTLFAKWESITTGVETCKLASIDLYPNPFSTHINIKNAQNVEQVVVTNIMGQQVINSMLNGINVIDTSHLRNGIFIVTLKLANGQSIQHRMVKR
jgi:hypothetical protein